MSTSNIIISDPKSTNISSNTLSRAFGRAEPLAGNHYKNDSLFALKVTLQITHYDTDSTSPATLTLTETILDTKTCSPDHFVELANLFPMIQLDQLTYLKKT